MSVYLAHVSNDEPHRKVRTVPFRQSRKVRAAVECGVRAIRPFTVARRVRSSIVATKIAAGRKLLSACLPPGRHRRQVDRLSSSPEPFSEFTTSHLTVAALLV